MSTPERASNYRKYLASREWAVLKEKVRVRSGGICERCFMAPHVQTHHVTYERMGHERLEDLEGVCEDCHEYLSGRSGFDPSRLEHHIAKAMREGKGTLGQLLEENRRLKAPIEEVAPF